MQFVITGFTHDMEFRVFAFERIGDDRVRTKCTVRADLALVRKYGIPIQELPLVCRNLLSLRDEDGQTELVTFSEDEICRYAKDSAASRSTAKRKPPRRPPSENVGAAWRINGNREMAAAYAEKATAPASANVPALAAERHDD